MLHKTTAEILTLFFVNFVLFFKYLVRIQGNQTFYAGGKIIYFFSVAVNFRKTEY